MADARRPSRLKLAVHWTLLSGVLASGSLMLLGLTLALLGNEPRPEGPPANIAEMFHAAAAGSGTAIVDLALLLLMLTPPLRVAVLAAGWTWSGNRRFALIALVVLALLGLSVRLGIG
jgi:hypothetical protein